MVLRPLVPFKWKGLHHSYIGCWFASFGFFCWYMCIGNGDLVVLIPFWQSLIGIGLYMLADDIVEHTYTADTPLRILYEEFICPILRRMKDKQV